MGDRARKDALFAEFAAVGKVLGNPGRLELLDLLSQGPRSVESLAEAADLGMSTCSAHLQTLREAGLDSLALRYQHMYHSTAPAELMIPVTAHLELVDELAQADG